MTHYMSKRNDTEQVGPGVKCRPADLRILNV